MNRAASGERRSSSAAAEARRARLEEGAVLAGERWADGWCESLRRQGRRPAGGWPGTVSEARALVVAHFSTALRGHGLTHEELESVTKTSYARAKHRWLALGALET